MRLSRLVLVPAVAALLAACSPSAAPASFTPTAAPPSAAATATPVASASPTATAEPEPSPATRIEVQLTDTLRIEPDPMTVPAGVPVTFVVKNVGVADHEFYLGDEEAQAAHEVEMQSMGGMGHDDPEGIAVEPGETRELTYTFAEPGATLAGCHVAGHYQGGMKATVTVVE